MRAPSRDFSSALASILLAALTITVFALAQNRGPQTAVQRFHEAIARRDEPALRAVTLPPTASDDAIALREYVASILQYRPNVQVVRVLSRGRRAVVQVVYTSPSLGIVTIPFSLSKPQAIWLVDSYQTTGLMRRQTART